MKRLPLVLLLWLAVCRPASAQTGYEISVTLPPYRNQTLYLGHYYGNQTPLVDSVRLNEQGLGTFRGKQPLGQGMYFVTNPRRQALFSLLMPKQQRFGLAADTSRGSAPTFTGSPENTRYIAYQYSIRRQNDRIQRLYSQLQVPGSDSATLSRALERAVQDLNAFRRATVQQQQGTLLSDLLRGMLEPEVPSSLTASPADPQAAYRYTKAHYFDGVSFYDDRMLRTPYFHQKLDTYYTQLVPPQPDSVAREIDRMMASAVISKPMEQYMLTYFLNRYGMSRAPWADRVFLHLYDTYLNQREYPWLTDALAERISSRAFSMMATSQGKPAPELELPDRAGRPVPLYSLPAPLTLLVFWDPLCGHCRQILPQLDSLYQSRWKAQGLQLYAVAIENDGTPTDWTTFVDQRRLTDWTHLYYAKTTAAARAAAHQPDYARAYEVYAYPTLYLLDADKRIMAKRITPHEVDRILTERQSKGK
jgi:thiol-disulfide isomerase/thioredoxin